MPETSSPFEFLQFKVVGAFIIPYNSVLCAIGITGDAAILKWLIYWLCDSLSSCCHFWILMLVLLRSVNVLAASLCYDCHLVHCDYKMSWIVRRHPGFKDIKIWGTVHRGIPWRYSGFDSRPPQYSEYCNKTSRNLFAVGRSCLQLLKKHKIYKAQ